MMDYPRPENIGPNMDYRAIYPYWYFFEVTLSTAGVSLPPQYLLADIKAGYDYIIEGIAATWPAAAAGGDVSPPPLLYLIQGGPGRALTEIPCQIDVITTPAARLATTQGGTFRGFVPIEHIFSYRDILEMRIQAPAGGDPVSAQVVVFGRNVKRKDE